jgi:DNA-binding transcriptional MerR regulator
MEVSIGELSRRTRVKVPTIRYYESVALMPAPLRSEGKQRRYREAEAARLTFIRHARELGFEIDAIRTLLALQDNPSQPCTTADRIAQARLVDVEQRIRSLTALKAELELMIKGCRRGYIATCRVIEVLADHGQCAHDQHSPRTRLRRPPSRSGMSA